MLISSLVSNFDDRVKLMHDHGTGEGRRKRKTEESEENGGNQKWQQPLCTKLCPAGQNWNVVKWDAATIDLEGPALKKNHQPVNFLVHTALSIEHCSKRRTSPGYQFYTMAFSGSSTMVDAGLFSIFLFFMAFSLGKFYQENFPSIPTWKCSTFICKRISSFLIKNPYQIVNG